jgi:ComEC/Rec2-related protein
LKTKKRNLFLGAFLLFAVVLALLSSYLFFHVRYQNWQERIGEECIVEGVILERETGKPYQSTLIAEVHKINGKPCLADVRLQFPYASSLQVGDRFRLSGIGAPFETKYMENEERNSIKDAILLCITSEDMQNCELLESGKFSLRATLSRWNFAASYHLEQTIGGEAGKLASALLLGTRDHLSGDTSLHFRRAGVSHLLALSGLHVSILVGLLEWILRRLRIPRQVRAILIPLVAILYLFLTGCSPSTLRAVLMLCGLYLALLLRERYDGFTVLCTVLYGILLFSPNAILDVSMWMSFVAAGSILIFSPLLSEWIQERDHWSKGKKKLLRFGRGLISAVFVAVTVNMAMLFLTVFLFGEISLFAVPATLLLSIPTTLVLILSLALLALPGIPLLASVTSLCAKGMLWTASIFSQCEGALLAVSDPLPRGLVGCFGVAVILFAIVRIQKRSYLWAILPAGFALTIAVALAAVYLPSDEADMLYIHKSDGCICLFAKDGAAVAVDFSGGRYDQSYLLTSSAREVNCTELRDLVFTRYANLQPYVLQENATAIRIQNLHLPVPRDDWERAMAKRMEQQASLYGITVHYGFEQVCAEVAEITATDRAAGEGTDHLGQFCALRVNGHRILLVNMAAMASPLNPLIDNLAIAADVVTVLDDGLTTQNRTLIPATRSDALCVILEEDRLLELLPAPIPTSILRVGVDKTRIYLK